MPLKVECGTCSANYSAVTPLQVAHYDKDERYMAVLGE